MAVSCIFALVLYALCIYLCTVARPTLTGSQLPIAPSFPITSDVYIYIYSAEAVDNFSPQLEQQPKKPVNLKAHLSLSNFYPLRSRRVTWIKTTREGVKSGYSGDLKPDRLGLSCKTNKCSDAGTGDLGVLTTHGTLLCSTRPG